MPALGDTGFVVHIPCTPTEFLTMRRIALAALLAAPLLASANLVTNGSFEDNVQGAGSWNIYASLTGWTGAQEPDSVTGRHSDACPSESERPGRTDPAARLRHGWLGRIPGAGALAGPGSPPQKGPYHVKSNRKLQRTFQRHPVERPG